MRTKFSNTRDCIHTFAQRTQSTGRASSVFFQGTDKIYSYGYHYLLAEFKEIDGETCILINDKGYSVTTSKHISITRQATRQYRQYFFTDIDLFFVFNYIESAYSKLLKARKPEIYISDILNKFEAFKAYPLNNSANVKKDIRFKKMAKIVKSLTDSNLLEKAKETAAKLAKAKAKKDAQKLQDSIKDFYNYEINYIRGNEDYLRLSIDGLNVETSQGVCVSIDEARILYSFIKAGKDIKGYKISNYTVISINGVLQIGCHRINIQSMHRIGQIISK